MRSGGTAWLSAIGSRCPKPRLELDVKSIAYGPVRLAADDGRVSHFVRALSRVEAADGRRGLGWIEWNLNQPA